MESIKEEPKDFGARGTTLSDIEQYPHAVGVGALIERDAENQSDSDTMTLGETEEQSPTHNMTLNELEDYSDVLGSGDLIPRDAEAQSEASTVILGDFEKHPDTPGAHAPELSLSVKNSPDEDSDEENQFALTPEPFTTPRGTTSSRSFSIIGSPHTQEQSLSPRRFENCMACQEGTREYFFGWPLEAVRYVFEMPAVGGSTLSRLNGDPMGEDQVYEQQAPLAVYHMTSEPTSPFALPPPAMMPQVPLAQVPMPQAQMPQAQMPQAQMPQAQVQQEQMSQAQMQQGQMSQAPFTDQLAQVPVAPWVGYPLPGPAGYVYVPIAPVQQPMAVPMYYPQYVPFGFQPMAQPVYYAPNGHFGGPHPPYATETWTQEMPETNPQRVAAAQYPVRSQTPYPPRYLPRNGSGFEYTVTGPQTPDRGPQSFTYQEPPSANRATTGSPLERQYTNLPPFESAHSFSHGQQ
ncbi:hypothetical protein N0V84_006292 [Fusarium piperis]|uniref:Uncharacterized protein n=1 Tax=Fusarium piperis TaxID=1435070 RepID=A0A9W8WC57_9HYPO|nr:hypothetical protein N0V84_006292 [Fusarium piperis]